MNKCLLAVLVLALALAACGGSSGGSSSSSSTDVAIWDQSNWDSGATWQP